MKLTYFQGIPPNFGDEVNAMMWQHLLPAGFLDEDDTTLFLGVGSILWDFLPKAPRKIVAGSGYGGYTAPPDVHDGSWEVLWLRGPRTADHLRLPRAQAITDAAVLLRAIPLPVPAVVPGDGVCFMPHVDSMARGDWPRVCAMAGITFLDPRAPVDGTLALIRGARLVITEAMHGAIIADALRRPWVGVLPTHTAHRAKWDDWALSLDIALAPVRLGPSNLREGWTRLTGLYATGQRSRLVMDGPLAFPANYAVAERTARQLQRLASGATAQLSSDAAIERATERCLDALDLFVTRTGPRTGPRMRQDELMEAS